MHSIRRMKRSDFDFRANCQVRKFPRTTGVATPIAKKLIPRRIRMRASRYNRSVRIQTFLQLTPFTNETCRASHRHCVLPGLSTLAASCARTHKRTHTRIGECDVSESLVRALEIHSSNVCSVAASALQHLSPVRPLALAVVQ